MSNINQTQNLFALDTVQNIDNETAATYSGGAGYLGSSDPDVILYKDAGLQGASLNLNAAILDGLSNIGTNDGNGGGGDNGFNDQTSSIQILRGEWVFHMEDNFRSVPDQDAILLGPGTHNLSAVTNDRITSAFRVG